MEADADLQIGWQSLLLVKCLEAAYFALVDAHNPLMGSSQRESRIEEEVHGRAWLISIRLAEWEQPGGRKRTHGVKFDAATVENMNI